MKKRPFERRKRDGKTELVDRYGTTTHILDRSFVRRTILRAPKPTVRELLHRVERGDWDAASALIDRRREGGVRRGFDALVRRTKQWSSAIERVTGTLGGEASRSALEKRLAAFARSRKTFDAAPHCNSDARDAARIARQILELDAEAENAADLLARLCAHPTAYNRMFATWEAAALLAPSTAVHTVAFDRLEEGVRPALEAEDEVFVKALPALAKLDYQATMARLKRVLRGKNAFNRIDAIWRLLLAPTGFAFLEVVVEWLSYEPVLRARLDIAAYLRAVIPQRQAREDAKTRRRLLARALRDEPDEDLRVSMKRALR